MNFAGHPESVRCLYMYALLADLIVTVHLLVVLFMVLGFLGICVGWPLGWSWIRNPWFRSAHLAIMAYIVFNAWRGELCFLTHWEADVRAAAGQSSLVEASFVGRLMHELTFVEMAQETLDRIYMVLGGLFLVQCLWIRPRPFRSSETGGSKDQAEA